MLSFWPVLLREWNEPGIQASEGPRRSFIRYTAFIDWDIALLCFLIYINKVGPTQIGFGSTELTMILIGSSD